MEEILECEHPNESYSEQYFPVVLFIMLYKVVLNLRFSCDTRVAKANTVNTTTQMLERLTRLHVEKLSIRERKVRLLCHKIKSVCAIKLIHLILVWPHPIFSFFYQGFWSINHPRGFMYAHSIS